MQKKFIKVTNFNSIKVRLEHHLGGRVSAESDLFQFHKGTIRTNTMANFPDTVQLFQFHKGTIRTI